MGCDMSRDRNKNWDLEALADHESSINVMAVSADESMLVTGSDDCTARIWRTDCTETECLGILRGHTDYITAIGTVTAYVITGSADKTIRKWEMATCDCIFVYEGHESRVTRILCTTGFIISSSYDKTCKVWFFDTDGDEESMCQHTFEGHTAGVYPICFIPGEDDDEDVKKSGGDEAGATEDEQEQDEQQQEQDEDLDNLFHPGDILITGAVDCTARSWSLYESTALKVFKGHRGPVSCMATDDLGKLLYTSGPDRTVREWNIKTGLCIKLLKGHTDAVGCMLVVNKLMYTGSADTNARCYITEFGDCTRVYKTHRDTVICLRFHNGIRCADMMARAFDAKSGNLKRTFTGHDAAINTLTVVGDKLYTGSSDGVLRVWDAKVPVDELSEMELVQECSAADVGDSGGGAADDSKPSAVVEPATA